jgi:hypothetical protein
VEEPKTPDAKRHASKPVPSSAQTSRAKVDHKSGEPKKHQPPARPTVQAPTREGGFLAQQRAAKKLKASRRMENTKR